MEWVTDDVSPVSFLCISKDRMRGPILSFVAKCLSLINTGFFLCSGFSAVVFSAVVFSAMVFSAMVVLAVVGCH